MKRVFFVELSNRFRGSLAPNLRYEVVAENASKAMGKAIAQAKKDNDRRGGWFVEQVLHRGPAV